MPLISDYKSRQPYTKSAGWEPIPGYVLIEPLGRGGFGEVWKCEAPGGLVKAIKFVSGRGDPGQTTPGDEVRQEFQAFQQLKAIRHPFLLSVERLDLLGNELVIVMELADHQVGERFHECEAQGLPGIPRQELLGYLLEAAEVLDVMADKHGLQHLDVKPANLFLAGGHVLLGDFGLVCKLNVGKYSLANRGLTPEYAAPEIHQGKIHARSDQYSLALVYFELLTGAFPFSVSTRRHCMEQHCFAAPDLSHIPERDRTAVGRALAKQPEERFPSCLAFVRALESAAISASLSTGSRPALVTPTRKRLAIPEQPAAAAIPDATPANDYRGSARAMRDLRTSRNALVPPVAGKADAVAIETKTPLPRSSGPPATPLPIPQVGEPANDPFPFKLEAIRSIFPIDHLLGRESSYPHCTADEMVRKVVVAAQAGQSLTSKLGRICQEPDGSRSCRFLTSIDSRVAQVKLNILRDEPGVTIETPTPLTMIARRPLNAPAKSSLFGGSSKPEAPAGVEIVVQLPETGRGTAEVLATGKIYGNPSGDMELVGQELLTKLMKEVRTQLNNIEDRRKDPRFAAKFPVTVYPLHLDGRPDAPLRGRCLDVSEGGLAILTAEKPPTRHLYVAFDDVPGIEGLAVLVQTVRSEPCDAETLTGGRYRLEFGQAENERP
jgi:serine/threonine protein kinase